MTKCGNVECGKKATFGIFGSTSRYCLAHKEVNMVDVVNKTCGCGKQPRWNLKGLSAKFCTSCKTDDMIEPNRKLCACGVRPHFNFEGLKAEFCKLCKLDGMINVEDKRCVCGKTASPSFNYEGLVGKYCGTCQLDGMINVMRAKCACGFSCNFNLPGLKPICCATCRTPGMIDLVHRLCFCGKAQPNFNYIGLPGDYCSKCKLEGMIDVRNNRCFCGKSQPTYNIEGLTARYCVNCKDENMIDVRHAKCKTLFCNIRVQEKYDVYCLRCFIHTYPDKVVARNYKTKEFAVEEFVTNTFPDVSWINDKIIMDGCSKKRPDMLLDLGYHVIIIEVDENQHKKYDCSCSNKRLMELSQDVNHRPIVFIRINPDEYLSQSGDKIKSCWGITKQTGICKIIDQKNWQSRLESLQKQIEYWSNPENKSEKTIEIIEMFYDQNL